MNWWFVFLFVVADNVYEAQVGPGEHQGVEVAHVQLALSLSSILLSIDHFGIIMIRYINRFK